MPDETTPTPTTSELEVEHTRTQHAMFPSALGIGDPVFVTVQGFDIVGWVRAVHFTNAKVRYSVFVPVTSSVAHDEQLLDYTTLHNLDSVLVRSRSGRRREWEPDNYS